MEEAERLCDRVTIIEHGRIVDIDRPAQLVDRHCPERTVVPATDDPAAYDRLRAMPRVVASLPSQLRGLRTVWLCHRATPISPQTSVKRQRSSTRP